VLFSLEKRRLWGDLIAAFQHLKRAYKKAGEGLFTRACSDRTRENGCKLKEIYIRYEEVILHHEGGEAQEQVAQRSCGCLLPESVQGQVGWGSEPPGVVEGVPAQGRGLEPDDL